MTPASLIRRTPCEMCDDYRRDFYTGAGYCWANPTEELDCEKTRAVEEMVNLARQVAALIARVHDPAMRRELAESTADGFANALYLKASFDCAAFMALSGVPELVAA